MNYSSKINIENINKFRITDIFYNTDIKKFKCVICARKVSISESTSIRGQLLICNNCAYEKFGNYAKAREWQDKEKVGD